MHVYTPWFTLDARPVIVYACVGVRPKAREISVPYARMALGVKFLPKNFSNSYQASA